MTKGFFITATGTALGKTLFTAGLLMALRKEGINAAPMKPVQTGMNKLKLSPDLALIFKLAGFRPSSGELNLMQPFTYRDACSPHLAAERQGRKYADAQVINKNLKILLKKYQGVIAEGAGGVFVPINRSKKSCMADIIKKTGLPAVVISHAGLGAINHACLTINALKQKGIKVAGFFLNDIDNKNRVDFIAKDNGPVISAYTGVKYLGAIPYLKNITAANLYRVFRTLPGIKKLIKEGKKWTEKK